MTGRNHQWQREARTELEELDQDDAAEERRSQLDIPGALAMANANGGEDCPKLGCENPGAPLHACRYDPIAKCTCCADCAPWCQD